LVRLQTQLLNQTESFVLGSNEHGSFKVKLKTFQIFKIIMAPLAGGTHSPIIVKPNETIIVKAEKILRITGEN
jgi:hypothetical protein